VLLTSLFRHTLHNLQKLNNLHNIFHITFSPPDVYLRLHPNGMKIVHKQNSTPLRDDASSCSQLQLLALAFQKDDTTSNSPHLVDALLVFVCLWFECEGILDAAIGALEISNGN
jgi:hypothetical protein